MVQSCVQGSNPPPPVEKVLCFCFRYRFKTVMLLYYGSYEDFNDCALRLAKNFNKYEVMPTKGFEGGANKQMQYRDAIQVLMVYAYNSAVKFFAPSRVHKQHLMVLGLSFLKAAYFFGGEFRDKCFTGPNKTRQKHERKLVHLNGAGRKTAMEELLTTKEGIVGWFYMDVDILSTVYKYMMDQLRFMGEFPRAGKHTMTKAWNRAYDKAVDKMVDKIGQQIFCQKRKLGRAYPVCLRQPGYLDYAYPLTVDDPQYWPPGPYHENWAGTLDDEVGEAEACGGKGPDVVIKEEIEEEIEEEITTIYDSANDPTVACHQPDPTPAESLTDILQSSVAELRSSEKQPTYRLRSGGESGNISTDSEMKEAMGELLLSAQMSEQLGPAPDALPNLAKHATTSTTQGDLNRL